MGNIFTRQILEHGLPICPSPQFELIIAVMVWISSLSSLSCGGVEEALTCGVGYWVWVKSGVVIGAISFDTPNYLWTVLCKVGG